MSFFLCTLKYLFQCAFFMALIYSTHSIWNYVRDRSTTYKIKNLYEVQSDKYRSILEDLKEQLDPISINTMHSTSEHNISSTNPVENQSHATPEGEFDYDMYQDDMEKDLEAFMHANTMIM